LLYQCYEEIQISSGNVYQVIVLVNRKDYLDTFASIYWQL